MFGTFFDIQVSSVEIEIGQGGKTCSAVVLAVDSF